MSKCSFVLKLVKSFLIRSFVTVKQTRSIYGHNPLQVLQKHADIFLNKTV